MSSCVAKLQSCIEACRVCVEAPLGKPLPHQPRPVVRLSATARILVVGQAPGTRVHTSGLPFDDASGDRLRSWMGVSRDEFYDMRRVAFAPMGFCFPGQDANGGPSPRPECARRWRSELIAGMAQVEFTLLIGRHAQAWHLGDDNGATLTQTVMRWREILERPTLPRCLPLPHPSWRNTAWLKANPWFERDVVPELHATMRLLLDGGR